MTKALQRFGFDVLKSWKNFKRPSETKQCDAP